MTATTMHNAGADVELDEALSTEVLKKKSMT
jgi:hypothetical protein